MKKLVFATNNTHKLAEAKAILEPEFQIVSLSELNFHEDIDETAHTLEGNALIKAEYIHSKFGLDCFADDTGLEIEALNGAPGVLSARYAGENHDAQRNMAKVLDLLGESINREACFRTVIALIQGDKSSFFEGKIEGSISMKPSGKSGFGYDPIFIPDGYYSSFAELSSNEKNTISHRALALQKLTNYLNQKT
ncbi:MAG: non-canonical purine NTP diphosphatase [Paludibacter sp.]